MRPDGRENNQLRAVKIQTDYIESANGSAFIEFGKTKVICTAMVENRVPQWLHRSGKGWLSAEYAMLPASTSRRKARDRMKTDGRGVEIQRLIGRSLRGVIKTELLGERTIWIDCDVIQADGGTRTASITGAYVALCEAVKWMKQNKMLKQDPMIGQVAAVSVGICKGEIVTDICYEEDVDAEVDMNIVMLDNGEFIEVQGTGEKSSFSAEQLAQMLAMAKDSIAELFKIQKDALSTREWEF